jgi:hypothetical protein
VKRANQSRHYVSQQINDCGCIKQKIFHLSPPKKCVSILFSVE